MNIKALTEEETKIILSYPKINFNKALNLYQDKKEFFDVHYNIRVVLKNPIDPMFNTPELFLKT